ncbi:MAG: hypothetical protein NTY23_10835 [Chloroflexi bacterium]|nr:hypothetical protein [Chloroflexota bacterium]
MYALLALALGAFFLCLAGRVYKYSQVYLALLMLAMVCDRLL